MEAKSFFWDVIPVGSDRSLVFYRVKKQGDIRFRLEMPP